MFGAGEQLVRNATISTPSCLNPFVFPMQAIQIVSWLAKYKPKTLVRHKLVTPILVVMCPILAEPDARHSERCISL